MKSAAISSVALYVLFASCHVANADNQCVNFETMSPGYLNLPLRLQTARGVISVAGNYNGVDRVLVHRLEDGRQVVYFDYLAIEYDRDINTIYKLNPVTVKYIKGDSSANDIGLVGTDLQMVFKTMRNGNPATQDFRIGYRSPSLAAVVKGRNKVLQKICVRTVGTFSPSNKLNLRSLMK